MAEPSLTMSISEFQLFIKEVYEIPNNRHFEIGEMLSNIQRFSMRGLKGIRKRDIEKTKKNLIISFSWFLSILHRLEINLEEEVWNRFPYVCSYCGTCPCSCKATRPKQREKLFTNNEKRPTTLLEFQKMLNDVYPPLTRTLEHAGVHFAEEIGEFSEALWAYRSNRTEEDFQKVKDEAADYFSCLIGIFNSLNLDLVKELTLLYPQTSCHECKQKPCICTYDSIKQYGI